MTNPAKRAAHWVAATIAVLALGLTGCADDGADTTDTDSGSGSGSGSGSASE